MYGVPFSEASTILISFCKKKLVYQDCIETFPQARSIFYPFQTKSNRMVYSKGIMSIEPEFSEKCKRKVKTNLVVDKRAKMTPLQTITLLQNFKIQLFCELDTLVQQI